MDRVNQISEVEPSVYRPRRRRKVTVARSPWRWESVVPLTPCRRPLSPFEALTGVRFLDHVGPRDVTLDELLEEAMALPEWRELG